MIDCPALHKLSEHYPARFGGRIPKTIRMLKTVLPDMTGVPVLDAQCEGIIAEIACHYPAWTNSHGAVCAVLDNGQKIGVKPDEFEVIEWY